MHILKPIAESGNAEAQTIIGNLYQLSLGVTENLAEAAKWYRKASDQGYGLASSNLAGIMLRGYENFLPDVAEAERLFQLARDQGFEHAPTTARYLTG